MYVEYITVFAMSCRSVRRILLYVCVQYSPLFFSISKHFKGMTPHDAPLWVDLRRDLIFSYTSIPHSSQIQGTTLPIRIHQLREKIAGSHTQPQHPACRVSRPYP